MLRLLLDLQAAARSLQRNPGISLAAIATLGIGIGAVSTIGTATRAALTAAPKYLAPDELVVVRPGWTPSAGARQMLGAWSYPLFEAVRDDVSGLPPIAAYTPNAQSFNISADGVSARRARIEMVSAAYFEILGVRPALGRAFDTADDAAPGGRSVVLLAEPFWKAALAGDPAVVGQTVRIEKQPYTVIGVMPAGFNGISERAEAWVPIATAPALTFPRRLRGALSFWHGVVARAPLTRRAEFEARLEAAAPGLASRVPLAEAFGAGALSFAATPLVDLRRDPALARALVALSAAAAAVLLIAWVNVANLLLVRAAQRSRELAVRIALGAGRRGLVGQALSEALLLALGAAALGLALVPVGLAAVRAFAPPAAAGAVGALAASVDSSTIVSAVAVAILAACALAFVGTRASVTAAPAERLRGRSGPGAGEARLRRVLVVVQLALVLVLATLAGLLGKSLRHLTNQPLGFDPRSLLSLRVDLPRSAYDDAAASAFFERAVERLAALPGVTAAAVANCVPFSGTCDRPQMRIAGRAALPGEPGMDVWMNMVDPVYFDLLDLPIRAGRGFAPGDRAGAPRVAVVDQATADTYWPGVDPVGQRIQLTVGWGDENDWAEVVGVVGALPAADRLARPEPGVYLSFAQYAYGSNFLILETALDPLDLASPAERVIQTLDPDLAVWDIAAMNERVDRASAATRFSAVLLGSFGIVATALAALGVYGVVAFGVTRRTREFGVRLALGARRGQLLRQVLAETMQVTTAGIALGVVAALAAGRIVGAGMVVTGSAYDPLVLAGASLLLAVAALLASLAPAARAALTDPIRALQDE